MMPGVGATILYAAYIALPGCVMTMLCAIRVCRKANKTSLYYKGLVGKGRETRAIRKLVAIKPNRTLKV